MSLAALIAAMWELWPHPDQWKEIMWTGEITTVWMYRYVAYYWSHDCPNSSLKHNGLLSYMLTDDLWSQLFNHKHRGKMAWGYMMPESSGQAQWHRGLLKVREYLKINIHYVSMCHVTYMTFIPFSPCRGVWRYPPWRQGLSRSSLPFNAIQRSRDWGRGGL